MNTDDFREHMPSFLSLRYLSDNYAAAAARELGAVHNELTAIDQRIADAAARHNAFLQELGLPPV